MEEIYKNLQPGLERNHTILCIYIILTVISGAVVLVFIEVKNKERKLLKTLTYKVNVHLVVTCNF